MPIALWSVPGALEPLKDPSAGGGTEGGDAVRKCMAALRPSQAVAELAAKEREKSGAVLREAYVLHLEVLSLDDVQCIHTYTQTQEVSGSVQNTACYHLCLTEAYVLRLEVVFPI